LTFFHIIVKISKENNTSPLRNTQNEPNPKKWGFDSNGKNLSLMKKRNILFSNKILF